MAEAVLTTSMNLAATQPVVKSKKAPNNLSRGSGYDDRKRNKPTQAEQDAIYTIDFSRLNLKHIPDLWKYKYCKSLDLSFNLLTAIPDEAFQPCNHLKELKLYDNKLVTINKCLRHLSHLENLQLQYNYMTNIGDSLSDCKKLNCLRLDFNKLSTITIAEMCSLHNLTSLDISSNKVEDISFLRCLVSLEEFRCTHNGLQSVPEIKGLKKLRDIDLSYNSIANISGLKFMSALNILNIEGNRLRSLTKSGVLKSLIHLNISRNRFKKLSELPDQFLNLEILDFSFNELSDVTELQHLFKFENLKELMLEGNPIVTNYEEKDTMELKEVISKLSLHYYNNRCTDKQKPHFTRQSAPMRPISANCLVSSRLITDQLRLVETLLENYENDLNAQFNVVNSSLQQLPSARPKSSPSGRLSSQNHFFHSKRPSSNCSSRNRIADAKAFAATINEKE